MVKNSVAGNQDLTGHNKMALQEIKRHIEQSLHGCKGHEVDRLLLKIQTAYDVETLWMLRSDAYLAVSKQHDQAEAALRINNLLQCFERWLPARQLSKI